MNRAEREAIHQKETRKQVILPAWVILLLLGAGIAGLIVLGFFFPVGMQKTSNYLTSVIFFLLMLLTWIVTIVLWLASSATRSWIKRIPEKTDAANREVMRVEPIIIDILNKSTEPLVAIRSWKNAFHSLWKKDETGVQE